MLIYDYKEYTKYVIIHFFENYTVCVTDIAHYLVRTTRRKLKKNKKFIRSFILQKHYFQRIFLGDKDTTYHFFGYIWLIQMDGE